MDRDKVRLQLEEEVLRLLGVGRERPEEDRERGGECDGIRVGGVGVGGAGEGEGLVAGVLCGGRQREERRSGVRRWKCGVRTREGERDEPEAMTSMPASVRYFRRGLFSNDSPWPKLDTCEDGTSEPGRKARSRHQPRTQRAETRRRRKQSTHSSPSAPHHPPWSYSLGT